MKKHTQVGHTCVQLKSRGWTQSWITGLKVIQYTHLGEPLEPADVHAECFTINNFVYLAFLSNIISVYQSL